MKYYIYEDTYLACSQSPKRHLDQYKEISEEEYRDYMEGMQEETAIINEESRAIADLVSKGYTVYK